jgi:hypothetical protein
MAYHPQTDGTTERVNQEIEAYLAIYCHSHPETWKKSLATLEFTHNNQRHADRPKTSFEIIQGESPKALPLTYENTKFPSIDDKVKQMMADRDEALAAHELARTRMAERRRNMFIPFTVGQKVWLDTRNMKTNYHKKMTLKREGPFEIEEVLGPVTYQLNCQPHGRFTTSSMPYFLNLTSKPRYMAKTSPNQFQTFLMEKKFTMWKQS